MRLLRNLTVGAAALLLVPAHLSSEDEITVTVGSKTFTTDEQTPGSSPGYREQATPGGTRTVRFDGVRQYLEITENPSDFDGRARTTLVVFRTEEFGLRRMINSSFAVLDPANHNGRPIHSAHNLFTHASASLRIENRSRTGKSVALSTGRGTLTTDEFAIGVNQWTNDGRTRAILRNAANERFVKEIKGADGEPSGHIRTRIGAGGSEHADQFFKGEIAAVLIYNRELPEKELVRVEEYLHRTYLVKNEGAPSSLPVTDGLIVHLDAAQVTIEDGTVTRMNDRSGQENHAMGGLGDGVSSAISGTPVVPMWQAPYADLDEPGGGFPILEEAEHHVVWKPQSRDEWAFNHHAALCHFDGRFWAMWSNHPIGEDASGQRVLFAASRDGIDWSPPRVLFEAPDEVRDRGEAGVSLRPDRWVVVNRRSYAVAYGRRTGTPGTYPVAREVLRDGSLDKPFTLHPEKRREILPVYMRDSEPYWNATAAKAILSWYEENNVVSWWAQFGEGVPRKGVDKANLIEPLTYKATDDKTVLLLRFHPRRGFRHNNRMYVSFRGYDGEWAAPYPTDIPDSPNRTEPVVLPNGVVLLIGSQIAPHLDAGDYLFRDPLTLAVSRDGYIFDRVYSLRHGAPRDYRIDNIGGRTGGFAYNSSVVKDGWLYTLYSVGKEDIEITRLPLSALNL